jgi:uncharacterized protein YhaN
VVLRVAKSEAVEAVDEAFYKLAVAQRTHAWAESARHKQERDEALKRVGQLELQLERVDAERAELRHRLEATK